MSDILSETRQLVTISDRTDRITHACKLAKTIESAISTIDSNFVYGEEGVPHWNDAVTHLTARTSLNPMEAWMVAEVIATGAATAHQITTQEAMTNQEVHDLTSQLALGALRLTGRMYQVN